MLLASIALLCNTNSSLELGAFLGLQSVLDFITKGEGFTEEIHSSLKYRFCFTE